MGTAKSDGEKFRRIIESGDRDMAERIRRLIKKGADVNSPCYYYGDTAIIYAARQNRPEAARVLLENGADVNFVRPGGLPALMVAAYWGFTKVAEVLIEHGAYRFYTSDHGYTPFTLAEEHCHHEFARLVDPKPIAEMLESGSAALQRLKRGAGGRAKIKA